MPLNPGETCNGNNRNCSPTRGGCGYRYSKDDPKWQDGGKCPVCGFPRRCQNQVVRGSTKCRMHGAGSPSRGKLPGNPDWRSVFFPKDIAENYRRAMRDPDLRRFDRNLATQEAMILDAGRRISSGESGEAWAELSKALPQFIDELRQHVTNYRSAYNAISTLGLTEERKEAMGQAIDGLMNLIGGKDPEYLLSIVKKGRFAFAARDELRAWEEQQRKTKESDMKQLKDIRAMVAIDQFIAFTEAVAVAIEKRVEDPELRRMIGFDVQKLLTLPGEAVVLAPSEYDEVEE